MAAFGAQPEGTGPFCRDTALPLAYVPQVHGVRGALSRTKMASVAAVWIVLTGPRELEPRRSHLIKYRQPRQYRRL